MSEKSHDTNRADSDSQNQRAPEENTEGNAGPQAAETNERPESENAAAEDESSRAEAQAAEFRERYLRAVAELENYRRRAEKERQDTAKYAIASFARDMLTMLDNLRRGLESVSAEDRKANPQLEALASGMEMTEREMLSTLERHGIEKIEAQGKPFDHNFHQAMMELEDPSLPAGTVAQVMQSGYVINGRLLRPAMVAVAKGGPKASAASADSGANKESDKIQAPIANEEVGDTPNEGGNSASGDEGATGDSGRG